VQWFEEYLEVLGVEAGAPTLESLHCLTRAQLGRIPFENISKLLYFRQDDLRGIPSKEQYVEGARRYGFGGTCYANNYYLSELLTHLGFSVRLCGASMSRPDVHAVIIVTLEEREWLVDVGYAAPLLELMPLDAKFETVVRLGDAEYVLYPRMADGRSRLEMRRDGAPVHGYTLNPTGCAIEHFAPAIRDSFRPDATFMNSVLLTRFSNERSIVVHNHTVMRFEANGGKTETLKDNGELVEVIEREFGIPGNLTKQALQGMSLAGNAWT